MRSLDLPPVNLQPLRLAFGDRLQEAALLSRYTAARLGGPAEALLEVRSDRELVLAVSLAWEHHLPFIILGGGSNVLVSESGVRGLVIVNKAHRVRFQDHPSSPGVWAESGVNFGALARRAAKRGMAGLEWAVGIPGSLGGAVAGNAGAHGSDMAGSLRLAEILHYSSVGQSEGIRREEVPAERFDFSYRSSTLKERPADSVVLSAWLRLENSTPQAVQTRIDEFVAYRRRTQPRGASLGSIFKNPPCDYAGRLVEAAGLKGARIGAAQISPLHANFIINLGQATPGDYFALIQQARQAVAQKFNLDLELEIELLGEW